MYKLYLRENKDYSVVIFSILGIIVIGIFSTSLNSFYWLDDFWKYNEMNQRGFWETLNWFYFNWDGRAISPIYWFRNGILRYIPYSYSYIPAFLALISLLISSIFLFKILTNHNKNLLSKYSLYFSLFIFCFLWISFSAHLSRSIYWATGSYYAYSNLILIIFLYLIFTYSRFSNLHLIFFFVVGTTGINTSLVMLVALIISKILGFLKVTNRQFYFTLIAICVSFMIVFIAPGNFKRGEGGFDFELGSIITNYFLIWKEGLLMSKWLLLTAFLFSFFKFKIDNEREFIKYFILFLILACVYLAPFSFFGSGAPKHTFIMFQTFLWIAFYFLFRFIFTKYFNFNAPLFKSLIFLFLLFLTYTVYNQTYLGIQVKDKISLRYKFLENNRGNNLTVFLDPIEVQENNITNRFWDIDQFPIGSADRYLQEYFEITKISLKTNGQNK